MNDNVTNRRSIHVYIASPYTKGDTAINVRFQLRTWDQLFSLGFTPIAPLWSHFQHLHVPRPYTDWTSYDNEIIGRCDVCLRLDAIDDDYKQSESGGADKEVELFLSLGKPVFTSVEQLLSWSDARGNQSEKAAKPNSAFREVLYGWLSWAGTAR